MSRLAAHDRPREKLASYGPGSLGDNELLAVVIGHGTAGHDALALAADVLGASGGLDRLPRLGVTDLARLPGLGAARAARVAAAVELGRRSLLRERDDRPYFRSVEEVAAFLLPQFGGQSVEQFGALLLDTKLRLLRTTIVATGGLDASVAQPREVFREAVVARAAAVVLFHTHPSGDPAPSPQDRQITERFAAAGRLLGIDVLDHVILGKTRYYSFGAERVTRDGRQPTRFR